MRPIMLISFFKVRSQRTSSSSSRWLSKKLIKKVLKLQQGKKLSNCNAMFFPFPSRQNQTLLYLFLVYYVHILQCRKKTTELYSISMDRGQHSYEAYSTALCLQHRGPQINPQINEDDWDSSGVFSVMLPLPDCQRNSQKLKARMLRAVVMEY